MIEMFRYFFYLGLTGFGGPLVIVPQMRNHFCDRHGKLTHQEFDQAFALIKAMPGTIAFQVAVFLGRKFHGTGGGFAAAIGFVLPSFLMMLLFGMFYDSFAHSQHVQTVLAGFLFAASAIILMSLKSMVVANKKYAVFWAFLILSMGLAWFEVLPEPALILGFGVLAILSEKFAGKMYLFSAVFFAVDWPQIYQFSKTCLYAGAVVFGTGYALIPVLKSGLVDFHHLVDLKQFNDGVVFGQMTPGPIVITATFLGYQISGLTGAVFGTVAIFLPPFFHMMTWFPLAMGWMSRQRWINQFLIGATAAVVGSIVVTVIRMVESSFQLPIFWILFFASAAILAFRPKISILLIFLVAGAANLLFTALGAV
jgi:chromate transporter